MIQEFIIKNDFLTVVIKRKGAELASVKDGNGFEFIWQAKEVWPRHAPNLFPVIGSLIDHEYTYEGKTFQLSHHGFARDHDFDLLHQSEHSAAFVLQPNEIMKEQYPFQFTLVISYVLQGNSLKQSFRVINNDVKPIPVSFGGHPAFNASPIAEYKIVFEQTEHVKSNQLTGPYINDEAIEIIDGNEIQLSDTIFDNDALIFQGLNSATVELKHNNSNHLVKISIGEFPYLAVWAKPKAPFVCIEPWQGIADYVHHSKRIEDKKGIVWVPTNQEISKSFTMEFTN